ncbi:MAG: ABC transporter permease [Deltaproteobacteria bacterium]|nr:ABC transporter permease [Deltaproteobacteria bacterium]
MNPRVVGANLVVSIKSFYREKTAMFFTMAFPIILILVFGTIFLDKDTVSLNLHVQDLDGTGSSAKLLEPLERNGKFRIIKVGPDVDAAQYAKDKKLNLVLVIPDGFERSLLQRTTGGALDASVTVTYVYDPSSTSLPTKLEILNSVFAGINQKMSGKPVFIRLAEKSILAKKYRFIEFFIPGIIAMAVMTASLFGTVNLNTELRQKGIIRKLSTTPITHTDWILANILHQFILAVISTIAMLVVSYAVFDVSLQINAWLPVFLLLDVFAFVGIGMILSRFVKEAQSAAAAANAIMFPMMFLSGSFFPIEMMPGFLQTLARILPLYYVNEGLRASMVFVDNAAALRHSAVIGIFAAVAFILGTIATRWEEV